MAFLHRKMLFPARHGAATLLLCLISWVRLVATDNIDGVLAFDLLPTTNSSAIGVLEVQLGSSKQRIDLLTTFYSNTDAALQVPVAVLCEPGNGTATGLWSVIQQPAAGDVLMVAGSAPTIGNSTGMEVVRWAPSLGAPESNLTLSLRKGRGDQAKNVTIIEGAHARRPLVELLCRPPSDSRPAKLILECLCLRGPYQ